MQARKFEHFLKHLGMLTRRQRNRLLNLLLPEVQLDRTVELIEHASSRLACPDCESNRLYRHGHANGLQRYRCRDCGRTCNALTGTPLARLRHKRDVLLVTDAHAAYKVFAHQAGITHEAVNLTAGSRVRGAIHVQHVNAYHSRLRAWLLPFRGIASRYLDNYLGWRWALDGQRIGTPANLLRAAIGVFNT